MLPAVITPAPPEPASATDTLDKVAWLIWVAMLAQPSPFSLLWIKLPALC